MPLVSAKAEVPKAKPTRVSRKNRLSGHPRRFVEEGRSRRFAKIIDLMGFGGDATMVNSFATANYLEAKWPWREECFDL